MSTPSTSAPADDRAEERITIVDGGPGVPALKLTVRKKPPTFDGDPGRCPKDPDGIHTWMDITAHSDTENHELCVRCQATRSSRRLADTL